MPRSRCIHQDEYKASAHPHKNIRRDKLRHNPCTCIQNMLDQLRASSNVLSCQHFSSVFPTDKTIGQRIHLLYFGNIEQKMMQIIVSSQNSSWHPAPIFTQPGRIAATALLETTCSTKKKLTAGHRSTPRKGCQPDQIQPISLLPISHLPRISCLPKIKNGKRFCSFFRLVLGLAITLNTENVRRKQPNRGPIGY